MIHNWTESKKATGHHLTFEEFDLTSDWLWTTHHPPAMAEQIDDFIDVKANATVISASTTVSPET